MKLEITNEITNGNFYYSPDYNFIMGLHSPGVFIRNFVNYVSIYRRLK